jgi:ketosteroid isomerase-like protein
VTPSANLDLVRSIYAAWKRGDFGPAEWAHPKIEISIADGPAPGSWTGPAGMAESFREWASAWEDYRAEVEEYREVDNERVLVLVHATGRGKKSGVELGQIGTKGASLFHVRDGKVTKLVTRATCSEALRDGSAPARNANSARATSRTCGRGRVIPASSSPMLCRRPSNSNSSTCSATIHVPASFGCSATRANGAGRANGGPRRSAPGIATCRDRTPLGRPCATRA